MKTSFYLIFICLFLTACDNGKEEVKVEEDGYLSYLRSCKGLLECMNFERPADSYNYPVYPGTEEWASFTTGQQRRDTYQIPIEVLKKMSTHAVIQAIWEHYYFFEYIVSSSDRYYQRAFDSSNSVFLSNNAYMELVKREDAGEKLLERFILLNPMDPRTTVAWFITIMFELLIAQPAFLAQFDNDALKIIVETAFEKDELREKYSSTIHNFFHRHITWMLMGRAMLAADYTPYVNALQDDEDLYLYTVGRLFNDKNFGSFPPIIFDFSKKFITEK